MLDSLIYRCICAVDVRTLSRQGTSLSSHWRDIADMASASDIGDPSPLKAAGSSGPFPPLPAPQRPFGSALEGLPAAYKRAGLKFSTKEQPPAQAMPTAYTLISGRPEFTNALAAPRRHCGGSVFCVFSCSCCPMAGSECCHCGTGGLLQLMSDVSPDRLECSITADGAYAERQPDACRLKPRTSA